MRQMSMGSYIKSMQARYAIAGRKQKKEILNQFCSTTHYHRKHAIRVLKHRIFWNKEPSGRKKEYEPEHLLEPLKRLWLATDQMCGKRLKVHA